MGARRRNRFRSVLVAPPPAVFDSSPVGGPNTPDAHRRQSPARPDGGRAWRLPECGNHPGMGPSNASTRCTHRSSAAMGIRGGPGWLASQRSRGIFLAAIYCSSTGISEPANLGLNAAALTEIADPPSSVIEREIPPRSVRTCRRRRELCLIKERGEHREQAHLQEFGFPVTDLAAIALRSVHSLVEAGLWRLP